MYQEGSETGEPRTDEQYEVVKDAIAWSMKYPTEWEIVCGIRNTSVENCNRIRGLLREAKLYVLCEIMAYREFQFSMDLSCAEEDASAQE